MTPMRPVILIVDDDEDVREIVSIVLEANGYETMAAADGVDALEKLREGAKPALVLLDLRMPRLSGEELMRELRAKPALMDIPVVVMSADHGATLTAHAIGARACMQKPMDIDQLIHTVARLTDQPSLVDASRGGRSK
jgi:CheY-like chemotaxis protein